MGDWIDEVFDVIEGRAVDEAVRFRLLDLAETAYLDEMEGVDIIMSIESDELTRQEADELWRRLLDAQPRVPDMYAPTQRMLSRWIRSFVFTSAGI